MQKKKWNYENGSAIGVNEKRKKWRPSCGCERISCAAKSSRTGFAFSSFQNRICSSFTIFIFVYQPVIPTNTCVTIRRVLICWTCHFITFSRTSKSIWTVFASVNWWIYITISGGCTLRTKTPHRVTRSSNWTRLTRISVEKLAFIAIFSQTKTRTWSTSWTSFTIRPIFPTAERWRSTISFNTIGTSWSWWTRYSWFWNEISEFCYKAKLNRLT